MSDTFVFSKILPANSIINPNVSKEDYLDYNCAFSFFDYLKYTKSNLSPNEINNLYVDYIRQWNIVKQNDINQINDSIKERYVDLLKEITLKYSSLEEKRFLSNIDFQDENDLDIVLPFYSQKIREICNFYSEKREKIKYKTQKNRIKGSCNSIQNAIYETITDILFSDVIEVGTFQKNISQEQLLSNLNIEIEELYDLYTSYLDNDPDKTYKDYDVKTQLRKDLYSANINRIDADLFLDFDSSLRNQIFENIRTFLTEFGRIFTINYDVAAINLNCKPDEKLYNLVNETKPTAARLVHLRNSLIKKYIGSDFYYIATGSTITDITSDILFKSDNPTGNLLNRTFPTTASVEEESDIQSCRRIGLFFTPEKNSILYYSVPEKKYKIDYSKLEPNKLYIYPDPERYGNTSGLSKSFNNEYPLIHICEYTKSVKNASWPAVEGDIESNPHNQDFYAYFSKNQLNNNVYIGEEGLKTNFSSVYNEGTITNWASDIFGNQYALFKAKKRQDLIYNTKIVIQLSSIISEEYDGGPITFHNHELLPEQIYAGHPSWVYPNVWASDYYYNLLIEGGIGGIVNGLMERGMYLGGYIVDGLIINRDAITNQLFDIDLNKKDPSKYTTIDGKLYYNIDPVTFKYILNTRNNSLNLSAIDYIFDAKNYNRYPKNIIQEYNKTLDGNQDNTSDFDPSFSYGYILSSIKYKDFDAGSITEVANEKYDFESQTKFIINKVSNLSRTITSENTEQEYKNSFELKNSGGSIYFRDVATGDVMPFLEGVGVQFNNKYSEEILNEIRNEVLDFNVFNDLIWIKTTNYIIFENLRYEDTKFVYTGSTTNYIKYGNKKYLDNITNPFIFENRSYSMIAHLSTINENSNNFYVIPVIYKIDHATITKEKIFPFENSDLTIFQNNSAKNYVKISRINKPTLTYNTRNDMFCIMSVIEDPNQFPSIIQFKFRYNGVSIFDQNIKLYNSNVKELIKTINFYDYPNFTENKIIFNDITSNYTDNFSEGSLIFS